jgi:GH18 family chitinase
MKAGNNTRFSIVLWPAKTNLPLAIVLRAIRWSLLAGSALLPSVAAVGQGPGVKPDAQNGFAIVGYLPDYSIDTFNPRQASLVTDLLYMAAEPLPSGELDLRRIRPSHLALLARLRKEHGTRIHVAFGGWERCTGFPEMAAHAEKRKRFVAAVADYCSTHDFSGVDLDWEFPKGESETADFVALLSEMHARLHRDNRSLSIALAPWQQLPEDAWEHVDRVHLMSYDHEGRHATFDEAKHDLERMQALKVPREKLLLGLPCYARHIEDRDRTLTWLDIVGRFNPPLDQDELNGYYYNGPATIMRKTKLAREEHSGGVFFWELGQDTDGVRSLVKAARETARAR